MAIPLTKLALGAAITAILVVPALPSNWLPDVMHAPAARAIPQLADSSARAMGNFLVSTALADEMPMPEAIDFSALVKISDADYVAYQDESVSNTILSRTNVKKIGHGNVSNVAIVKTPTGTYSSDGLTSPNVRYPGIAVERIEPEGGVLGTFWRTGAGWVGLPINPKNSIVTYGTMPGGGSYITNGKTACFSGPGYTACS